MQPEELRSLMNGFCGTEQYHRAMFCDITDGMKAVAKEAGAQWLVDAIGAVMRTKLKARIYQPMTFWRLTVRGDKATLQALEDIPGKELYGQEIEYTDFPEGEWVFYFQNGILFLPDEY